MSDGLREVRTRNQAVVGYINQLVREIPAAGMHRAALRAMGSDFSYAERQTEGKGEKGAWVACIRFGEAIESEFGFKSEVFVYYSVHRDLQPRLLKTMHSLVSTTGREVEPHAVFLWSPDPLAQTKVESWAASQTRVVIPLPNLSESAEDIAVELRARISRQLSAHDLFDVRLPVTGAEFFGRQRLLNQIVDEIRDGRVCGIFGLRKTGKTSFLTELGRQFELRAPNERIFLLRDLEDLPSSSAEQVSSIVMNLAGALLPRLRDHGVRTHEVSQLNSSSSIGDLRRALAASVVSANAKGVQLVLAFDEIESLVGRQSESDLPRDHVPEFLGALRSLVQENTNFNVIVAGITSHVVESGDLFGRENPLFAWAKPFFMPPLPLEDSAELITETGRRMGLQWVDDSILSVYARTGGHVFLLRTLSSAIFRKLGEESRIIDAEAVTRGVRQWRRQITQTLEEMYGSFARYYPEDSGLLGLFNDGAWTLEELEESYPSAVQRLLDLGLLDETGDELRMSALASLSLGS